MKTVEAKLDDWLKGMSTFYENYLIGEYDAYYLPENVFVLCSPYTYSSGFTFMSYLYKSGAKLVGTPSGQSGNCFGEPIQFELKNTGIPFTVSTKYFENFPNDSEAGKVLIPHYPMSYEILSKYGFDNNAELLYALDILGVNVPLR